MTNVNVDVPCGSTETVYRAAAVTPMPLVATGSGSATGRAPAARVAPQAQNQGWPVSLATKSPFVGSHLTLSRASVMPRLSENQTGRRSVLTDN